MQHLTRGEGIHLCSRLPTVEGSNQLQNVRQHLSMQKVTREGRRPWQQVRFLRKSRSRHMMHATKKDNMHLGS
jgi:hypothetical protein